jgi:lipooligosaccharide transport system permease protein
VSTPVPTREFLILPLPGLGARHLIERNVLVYKRIWLVIVSGAFEPLFYLLSLGFGLGAIIGDVTLANGQTVPYAAFVAPAMMATAAMNGAIVESTFNIFFKLNFARTYDGILSTPMGVADVAIGEIGWALMRGAAYAVGFYVVMLILGLVESAWSILAIPAAVLVGFAFAACGMAATTYMKKIQDFDLITLVQIPLFLFSATFFPITTYPPLLQAVVAVTPLYQGILLIRSLTLGDVGPQLLIPVAYLCAMGAIGLAICSRRLDLLLRK